jgi:GxxExxY protein
MTLSQTTSTLPQELEELITRTIGCCIAVHRTLGPGLGEGAYNNACCLELEAAGVPFEVEKTVSIKYRDAVVAHHRIDLIVDRRLILEIKAVERLHPVHVAQAVSYLRSLDLRAALLVNFNVPLLKEGIRRVVL